MISEHCLAELESDHFHAAELLSGQCCTAEGSQAKSSLNQSARAKFFQLGEAASHPALEEGVCKM